MKKQVLIRILDTDNSVLGDLDLKDFTDFPLVITKGIVNIDNLKARTGSYTKVFKVPSTKNNSALLNSVDDINSRKDYKDALNRKPCAILVDGAEVEKGFLQVSRVYNGFELDSFELVFFGNNVDWVKQASELDLRDITFNNNSQTYDSTGIQAANSATSDTYDHAYPLVDRSGDKEYKPTYYLRSLIERGLNHLGWNVSSSFLTDAEIKKLVVDFDTAFIVSDTEVNATKSRAQLTIADKLIPTGADRRIIYDDDTTPPNEDSNGNYSTSTGIYTVPQDGNYIFEIGFEVFFDSSSGAPKNYQFSLVKNGTSTNDIGTGEILDTYSGLVPSGSGGSGGAFFQANLNSGDTVSIYATGTTRTYDVVASANTYANIYRKSEIEDGDPFSLNEVIPRDITLIQVINDFTRMFNIYYWTDIKTKTIYFEPRDSFFLSANYNWTSKLDLNNKYEIDYVTSYKRDVEFKYRDLENDAWLIGWQGVNKRTYARYKHTLPDRFAEGTDTIQLDLFCAAYTNRANEFNTLTSGFANPNTSPITIRLWSEYGGAVTPDGQIEDYRPKIYQFNNGTQTTSSGISREINYFGTITTTIPYGIFQDYSNVSSGVNLSFTGSDGLFATYYSKMFKNIEEGGRLVAYFNLDNVDIENLDFRNLVYLDYPAEVKGYYLIESVIDYNPLSDDLTKVSLFKFENLGSVIIDNTQLGNNDEETDTGLSPDPLEPIYVEDGSTLIEVWIENPFTGALSPVYK
jgi:hypothetical protein